MTACYPYQGELPPPTETDFGFAIRQIVFQENILPIYPVFRRNSNKCFEISFPCPLWRLKKNQKNFYALLPLLPSIFCCPRHAIILRCTDSIFNLFQFSPQCLCYYCLLMTMRPLDDVITKRRNDKHMRTSWLFERLFCVNFYSVFLVGWYLKSQMSLFLVNR